MHRPTKAHLRQRSRLQRSRFKQLLRPVALHGFKWQRFSSGTRLKAEWDLVLAKRRVLHETLPQTVGALLQGEHAFRAASLWSVRVHWVGQNTHRPDGRTMRKRCTPSGTKLLRE